MNCVLSVITYEESEDSSRELWRRKKPNSRAMHTICVRSGNFKFVFAQQREVSRLIIGFHFECLILNNLVIPLNWPVSLLRWSRISVKFLHSSKNYIRTILGEGNVKDELFYTLTPCTPYASYIIVLDKWMSFLSMSW